MAQHHFASINGVLYESGEYSDLTITCGSRTWKVHRSVLCPQSNFFKVACSNGFMESHTNIIDLPEDDPDSVDRLLRYLYTHDYPGEADVRDHSSWAPSDDEGRGNELCDRLLEVVAMYIIADKYDIQPLRTNTMNIFNIRINNLAALPPNFPSVYRAICSLPPETGKGLKQLVAQKCAQHIQQIIASKPHKGVDSKAGLQTHDTWPDVLGDDGEMTFSLLECLIKQQTFEKTKLTEEKSRISTRLLELQRQMAKRW